MFLLVPAYPGSPGQKAVQRLCVCVLRHGSKFSQQCILKIHTKTSAADTQITNRLSVVHVMLVLTAEAADLTLEQTCL